MISNQILIRLQNNRRRLIMEDMVNVLICYMLYIILCFCKKKHLKENQAIPSRNTNFSIEDHLEDQIICEYGQLIPIADNIFFDQVISLPQRFSTNFIVADPTVFYNNTTYKYFYRKNYPVNLVKYLGDIDNNVLDINEQTLAYELYILKRKFVVTFDIHHPGFVNNEIVHFVVCVIYDNKQYYYEVLDSIPGIPINNFEGQRIEHYLEYDSKTYQFNLGIRDNFVTYPKIVKVNKELLLNPFEIMELTGSLNKNIKIDFVNLVLPIIRLNHQPELKRNHLFDTEFLFN